jgi:hypothetical protein
MGRKFNIFRSTFHQILLGDQIKEGENGGEYSTHGR